MPGILTNNRKTGPSTPVITTTVLTYDFPAYTDAEIGVYTIATDGTITKLVLTSGYTVTLGDAHADAGGTITLVVAANGTDQYVIYGESADGSNFAFAGSALDQVAIDNEFYMLREQIQELKEQLVRSMIFEKSLTDALSDIVMPSAAGGFLKLSAVGDPSTLVFATPVDLTGVTTTPFSEGFLDDDNAAEGRATLAVDSKVNTDLYPNQIVAIDPVLIDQGADTTLAFADFDITPHTGTDTARLAIVRISSVLQSTDGAVNSNAVHTVNLREKGTTPAITYNVATEFVVNAGAKIQVRTERTVFCPVDSGEVFQWSVDHTGGTTNLLTGHAVHLEGYVK